MKWFFFGSTSNWAIVHPVEGDIRGDSTGPLNGCPLVHVPCVSLLLEHGGPANTMGFAVLTVSSMMKLRAPNGLILSSSKGR